MCGVWWWVCGGVWWCVVVNGGVWWDCCGGHTTPPVRCACYTECPRLVDVDFFAQFAPAGQEMPVARLDRDKSVCVFDVHF